MTTQRDAYIVLQVHPEAEQAVIQAAYRALARGYHPDGQSPEPDRMTELNLAYERVRTSEQRRRYDDERRAPVAHGPGQGHQPPPFDPWATSPSSAPVGRPDPDVIDFGRYAGWRIADIARVDPDYLRWLSRHSTGVRFLELIARCLPGDQHLGRRTSWIR